jgi:hypothetical protein
MNYLNNHYQLNTPQETNFWHDFMSMVESVTPWCGLTVLLYRLIDRVAKWAADGRETQFKKIVESKIDETVAPEIKDLKDAIRDLTKSIGVLERQLNK